MILECLSKTDRIRIISDYGWKVVVETFKNSEVVDVQYQEIESIENIEAVLKTNTDIDILVISAHGQYKWEKFRGAFSWRSVWMPNSTINVPPVVILSACHVAPKGRGSFTVSDAFLAAGALAVLGTLIPVSVRHNAAFSLRFFTLISQVLEGDFDVRTLAEVLPRAISLNAVYEIITSTKRLRKWAYEKSSNGKAPIDEYYEKIEFSYGNMHSNTISILKEIARESEMEEYIDTFLQSQGYDAESFFYIFSGFPENILLTNKDIEQMIEEKFLEF